MFLGAGALTVKSPVALVRSVPYHRGTMIKQAVEALEANQWNQAHEIVQNMETIAAYWLHGILHTIEGDLDNARYWYGRAGRPFSQTTSVAGEIKALKEQLGL